MPDPNEPHPRTWSEFFGPDPQRRRRAFLGLAGIALILAAFFGITIAVLLNYGRSLPEPTPELTLSAPQDATRIR